MNYVSNKIAKKRKNVNNFRCNRLKLKTKFQPIRIDDKFDEIFLLVFALFSVPRKYCEKETLTQFIFYNGFYSVTLHSNGTVRDRKFIHSCIHIEYFL